MARHYLSRTTRLPGPLLDADQPAGRSPAPSRASGRSSAPATGPTASRASTRSAPSPRVTAPILLVHGDGRPPRPPRASRTRSPRPCRRAAPSGTSRAPATATTPTSRRRWRSCLRAEVGGVLRDVHAGVASKRGGCEAGNGRFRPASGLLLPASAFLGSTVRPFSCPHAADASGPLLRRTVTAMLASTRIFTNARWPPRRAASSRAGRSGPRSAG